MPVLPEVGSSSSRPGSSSPAASAASIIASATRSLIEPVGFWPSSFAYSRTDGFGARRRQLDERGVAYELEEGAGGADARAHRPWRGGG